MTIRTQTRSPGTVVSDDAVGTVAWSDPEKAEVQDNDPAAATGPGITEWLLGTNYSFNILSTASLLTAALRSRVRISGSGLADIVLVGTPTSATSQSGGSASLNVNVPAGTTGDGERGSHVMVMLISRDQLIGPVSLTGWTAFASVSVFDNDDQVGSVALLVRVANNEPGSYTVNFSSTAGMKGVGIATFSGIDVANLSASTGTANSTAGTSHSASQVTTTSDKALLLRAATFRTGGSTFTVTGPGGMTQRIAFEPAAGSHLGRLWTEIIAAAGATGNRVATTSDFRLAGSIMRALRPASNAARTDAFRLVVGGIVGTDDYSVAGEWTDSFADHEPPPIDISSLSSGDIDSDLGVALSVDVDSGVTADVDLLGEMTIAYDIPVDVTITEPSGGTIDAPSAVIEWDAEVAGTPIVQASCRVRGYRLPALTLIYDSGVIATATQSHIIGSGTPVLPWASPQQGDTIRWRVDLVEDGTADPDGVGPAIEGFATIDLVNDWTPPTAPTGLAVTFATEAP